MPEITTETLERFVAGSHYVNCEPPELYQYVAWAVGCIREQEHEIERLNQELKENSKRAKLLHDSIARLTLEIAEKEALLKETHASF